MHRGVAADSAKTARQFPGSDAARPGFPRPAAVEDHRMIALLGGTGYIGAAFQRQLGRQGLETDIVSRQWLDYTRVEPLRAYLRERRPRLVILAAGYTGRPNVDACETHRAECLAANTLLPATVRSACEDAGVAWGYVASGCIYAGCRDDGSGFREHDPPNFSFRQGPCSFYSGTKALAEELLVGAERCYLWRLRMPFEQVDSPRNYLSKLLRYERLLDVRNSLSHLDEYVTACLDCWRGELPYGTYNLTNPGAVTTRDVVALMRQAGLTTKSFQYFASEEEFLRTAARTPRSSCLLDSTKALRAGLRLRPVQESLEWALRHWMG
jgi:dTDP-4-dehydrorhamnose reductase